MKLPRRRFRRGRHTPDRVADVVGDQQRALLVEPHLPGMDGFALARWVRHQSGGTKTLLAAISILGGQEAEDYLSFVAATHDDDEIRAAAAAARARLARRRGEVEGSAAN